MLSRVITDPPHVFFTPSFRAERGIWIQGERGILTGKIDGWAAAHISLAPLILPSPLSRDALGK